MYYIKTLPNLQEESQIILLFAHISGKITQDAYECLCKYRIDGKPKIIIINLF